MLSCCEKVDISEKEMLCCFSNIFLQTYNDSENTVENCEWERKSFPEKYFQGQLCRKVRSRFRQSFEWEGDTTKVSATKKRPLCNEKVTLVRVFCTLKNFVFLSFSKILTWVSEKIEFFKNQIEFLEIFPLFWRF